jgi:hypothetical protein
VAAIWEGQGELVERYYREAVKLRRQIGARALYAHSLGNYFPYVALLLAERGEPYLATELLASGLALPNATAAPELKPDLSRLRVELKEKLGEGPFTAAWERGHNLDPTTAAEEAFDALEPAG